MILNSAVVGEVEPVLVLLPSRSRWNGDGVGGPCLGCLAKLCSLTSLPSGFQTEVLEGLPSY